MKLKLWITNLKTTLVCELERVIEMRKVYSLFDDHKGVPNRFKGQWRSIEFELIFNSQQVLLDFETFVKKKRYSRYVTVKGDGSIQGNGIPKEVCVSFRVGKDEIVRDVCGFLKGNAHVNKSCGTHVHFDMRGVEQETVVIYGKRLAKAVPALKTILPASRRNNMYCDKTINTLTGYSDRYAFVNLQAYPKHKTIEVRGHSGTLNASKILNWIKLCESIMLNAEVKKRSIKDIKALIENYELSDELRNFLQKRFHKLNTPKEIIAQPTPAVIAPEVPVFMAAPMPLQTNE
jgi:hypothetical protein